jgi:hypothetical protein
MVLHILRDAFVSPPVPLTLVNPAGAARSLEASRLPSHGSRRGRTALRRVGVGQWGGIQETSESIVARINRKTARHQQKRTGGTQQNVVSQ